MFLHAKKSTEPKEQYARVYVFADPFGRVDSGVSQYIQNARNALAERNFKTLLIKRKSGEGLKLYRKRLAKEVLDLRHSYSSIIIEAPESGACTTNIPSAAAEIHIRLHCSRQLAALIQNEKTCTKSLRLEQQEINRAAYISAPSWSAVITSQTIFKLKKDICCYPNPAPNWTTEIPAHPDVDRRYVVFVGRFHGLKGIHWVYQFAQRLPQLSFVLVGPTSNAKSKLFSMPNVRFEDGNVWSKRKIYTGARLVIIPSLYETASMVGIEALSAGVPVVTWSHLGIAEYAAAPMVNLVAPFQVDEFCNTIQEVLRAPLTEQSLSIASVLNDRYYKGLIATLSGGRGCFMPVALTKERKKEISLWMRNLKDVQLMPISNLDPRWRRKLRKLQRDPIQFFRDSLMIRLITPPGGGTKPEQPFQLNSPTPDFRQFVDIDVNKKIKFQDPPTKPEGLIVAFLYPKCRTEAAQEVIASLHHFDDFRYVQLPMLQTGTFPEMGDVDATQLVELIDRNNKKRISAVDHLLLLDPPPVLVEGLRSCGTRQRTIVILEDQEKVPPDLWHTDVLIVIGTNHPAAATKGWRRKIVINDRGDLPLAIRRATQEGTPKSPDMLLPLIGFSEFQRQELMNIDVRFHQGVIVTKSGKGAGPRKIGSTMADICDELARDMTDLAVSESVYLRYRSLCDRIEDVDARARFLSYSINDGVVFDVRT